MKRGSVLLLLAACGPGPATAVRVGADFEPGLVVRQLSFSGVALGAAVFGPALRPEAASAEPLDTGGELLVLLPDRLDARELTCSVSAYDEGRMIAWSQSMTVVRAGEEVGCRVMLRRAAPPMTPACGGCVDDRGRCRSGTEDAHCGGGGGACVKCGDDENRCQAGRCQD